MKEIEYTVEKEGRELRIIRGCVINGYDLNKYEVAKGFTPKELYERDCPKELFLYVMDQFVDFDSECYTKAMDLQYYDDNNPIIKFFPWFLENGYIKKKKVVKLTQGLKLREKGTDIISMICLVSYEDYRHICLSGRGRENGNRYDDNNWYGKTLDDLNRGSAYEFEAIYK